LAFLSKRSLAVVFDGGCPHPTKEKASKQKIHEQYSRKGRELRALLADRHLCFPGSAQRREAFCSGTAQAVR
jgi:hypothetical protein